MQALAVAVGHGKMPRYDSARLAGMLAEHTYWYTDTTTAQAVLKPLAERAIKLSPSDTHLWRLVFKLNSKLKTYAGRNREAGSAMRGAVIKGLDPASASAAQNGLMKRPMELALEYKKCRERDPSMGGCFVYGRWWFPHDGSRMSVETVDGEKKNVDNAFGLLRVGSALNRSRALSDADELVKHLVGLAAANPAEMAASDSFRSAWEEFESAP